MATFWDGMASQLMASSRGVAERRCQGHGASMEQLARENVVSASDDLRNGMVSYLMSSSRDDAHKFSSSLRPRGWKSGVSAS